jgi:SAM-dependent methyltransferase
MLVTQAELELPDSFAADAYRASNPDLVSLSDDDLFRHFERFGEVEGRRADWIDSREAFAALIPADADALEIGPYYSPLLATPRTWFFDVLSRPEMLVRAEAEGFDGSTAPNIDYVSPTGDLNIVDQPFDFAFSSHTIEHQPDLIGHLQQVERLLRPGGRYFTIVPDKRYCFDHFSAESGLHEIVEAHIEKRTLHTLRSVLSHSVMTTHNDAVRHWNGDHGVYLEAAAERIAAGLAEYAAGTGVYLDVHAWYFTPASARAIFTALREAAYVDLELERLYPTRRNTFEFWAVLRKPGAGRNVERGRP